MIHKADVLTILSSSFTKRKICAQDYLNDNRITAKDLGSGRKAHE